MVHIYDGSSGQMLLGLGEAHNADMLLKPPVQTSFLNKTRLLVKCKDYKRKVGLDVARDDWDYEKMLIILIYSGTKICSNTQDSFNRI